MHNQYRKITPALIIFLFYCKIIKLVDWVVWSLNVTWLLTIFNFICYCSILAPKFLLTTLWYLPSISVDGYNLFFCEHLQVTFGFFSVVKMKRLKEAKDEAEREAANYRSYLETEFQKKVSDVGLFNCSFAVCILTNKKPYSFNVFFLVILCRHIRFHILVWAFSLMLSLQSSGFSGSNLKRLEEDTEKKINNLKSASNSVSPDVVGLLLKCVKTIRTW